MDSLVRTCNITHNYVEKDDQWSRILAAAEFAIFSTTNRLECYSSGQLIFVCDMILPIKHTVDWELPYQKNQEQINKYNTRENRNQVEHDYKFRDKIMLNKQPA